MYQTGAPINSGNCTVNDSRREECTLQPDQNRLQQFQPRPFRCDYCGMTNDYNEHRYENCPERAAGRPCNPETMEIRKQRWWRNQQRFSGGRRWNQPKNPSGGQVYYNGDQSLVALMHSLNLK